MKCPKCEKTLSLLKRPNKHAVNINGVFACNNCNAAYTISMNIWASAAIYAVTTTLLAIFGASKSVFGVGLLIVGYIAFQSFTKAENYPFTESR